MHAESPVPVWAIYHPNHIAEFVTNFWDGSYGCSPGAT
jgi:hypothetical protein